MSKIVLGDGFEHNIVYRSLQYHARLRCRVCIEMLNPLNASSKGSSTFRLLMLRSWVFQ